MVSPDGWGTAPGLGLAFLCWRQTSLEAMGTTGKPFFSPSPRQRVHLASKYHLLEVVSTVNDVEDGGHLRRGLLRVPAELGGPENA